MTFAAPIWLYITPAILVIMMAVLASGLKQRESLLAQFAAARLLPNLTEQANLKRVWIKAILILAGMGSIGIALARPQYGVEWTERKARSLDIVFVLDSSKSMLATDLRPNRLERAKYAILDLIDRLESDRIGLVAFAGRAFLQTPPTLDYPAFRESLESIDPSIMTSGGSELGTAIKEAAKAFPSKNNIKVVVLLTDGEDLGGEGVKAARAAAEVGIKIYAIGIGTPEGEYLRIQNEQGEDEFVRNAQGEPVRSQLDETTLQGLANATGGNYSRLSDRSLDMLYNSVIANLPREERESEMQEARIERFQWALALACIFLALEIMIRRRSRWSQLAILVIIFTSSIPSESQASPPSQAQENQAELTAALNANIDSKDESTPEALNARALYNQAHVELTEGHYDAAMSNYSRAIKATQDLTLQRNSLYNMGHASFQIGEAALQQQDFHGAIKQWYAAEDYFKSAHQIDPSDANAATDGLLVEARRKALEEFLKQQDQQDSSQQQQDSSQQQDQQQDQQQNSNKQPQEQEQSQGSEEQQNGEQQEQQNNEGNQSDEPESEQQEQGSNTDPQESDSSQSQNQTQESAQDPLEDLLQGDEPSKTEEQSPPVGDEASEEIPESSQQAGNPSVGDPSEEELKAMRISEAEALLDSLRGNERLLPFSAPSQSQKRDTRDW